MKIYGEFGDFAKLSVGKTQKLLSVQRDFSIFYGEFAIFDKLSVTDLLKKKAF